MNITEPLGYLASALVLATFCMRDMVALRCMAIASNLAFIAYGALADLGPVLLLHLLLLPVNVQRLIAWRSSMQAAGTKPHPCNFKERHRE
jgi:CRP/FNR family transcriptional regulator, cyclic AMP receptor protein